MTGQGTGDLLARRAWVKVTGPGTGNTYAGYLVEFTTDRIVVEGPDGARTVLHPSMQVEEVAAPRVTRRRETATPQPPPPVADAAPARAVGEDSLPEGRWANISFVGHIEYWGVLVRDVTRNGVPAYMVELPAHVWGGDPYAVRFHAASAWFAEQPVSEAAAREAWEAQQARAAERARQQAGYQRALTAGEQHDPGDAGDGGSGPF